jgi:hypothetical protein
MLAELGWLGYERAIGSARVDEGFLALSASLQDAIRAALRSSWIRERALLEDCTGKTLGDLTFAKGASPPLS